ncbi:MAG: TerC family protein [Gemmatimonadetes bacterium]|nr:TerC family protein [Gemmatimonadota bacterium]
MLWAVFAIVILAMMAIDLGVLHRRPHEVKVREALLWSGVWIGVALAFLGLLIATRGMRVGLEFLTCYLIEESLSVDNLFVFLVLFTYFRVPPRLQHKALFWGIIGAIVMRAVFIAAGVAVVQRFQWLAYVLGALLVVMGIRMGVVKEQEVHPERNPVLRLFRRVLPVTEDYVDARFFIRRAGRLFATPLFVVLLVIETTDVVFAVDSVPAALAITLDPFVVYTANIFAILGLRSLYFALAGIMPMFAYLHYGLSVILVFTGIKMILAHWVRIPIGIVLLFIGLVLVVSVIASVIKTKQAVAEVGKTEVG